MKGEVICFAVMIVGFPLREEMLSIQMQKEPPGVISHRFKLWLRKAVLSLKSVHMLVTSERGRGKHVKWGEVDVNVDVLCT